MVKEEKPAMNKMMSAWLNVRKRREAAIAPSGSDVEEDEKQSLQGLVANGGDTTTTSESECELSATKRPRYRDYKQVMRKSKNGNDATDSALESDGQKLKS